MIGEDAYRQVGDSLIAYFESAVSDLRQDFPGIWVQLVAHEMGTVPFVGYLSIVAERDPSRDEDCVLMMEVERRPDRLIVTSDISTAAGDLLAIGPTFEIADADPEEVQVRVLRTAEKAIEEFFAANLDEVRRILRAAREGDTAGPGKS
jgi:hypothetical protein